MIYFGGGRTESPGRDEVPNNLAGIVTKIAVMSGKGGVGKTTVAVNLACALAAKGLSVGLLDADFHGPNVPKMMGLSQTAMGAEGDRILPVKAGNGVAVISMAFLLGNPDTPVIWRGPLKMQVMNQFLGQAEWGNLDYLIIDLPPGTGDESLSIAQLIPGAKAVIVTTPQEVALLDSRKSVSFARQLGMEVLGIVENMSGLECPHCHKSIELFKTGGGERAAAEMGVPFLGRLPIDPEAVTSGDSGEPAVLRSDGSKIASELLKITDKIEKERRK